MADHEVEMAQKLSAARADAAERAGSYDFTAYWQWVMVAAVGVGVIVLATAKNKRWGT